MNPIFEYSAQLYCCVCMTHRTRQTERHTDRQTDGETDVEAGWWGGEGVRKCALIVTD